MFAVIACIIGSMTAISYEAINVCPVCIMKAEIITGVVFTFLAIMFGLVGCLILRRIKKYFGDFYKENKHTIFFATLGLTIPLLTRGLVDLLRYTNESFNTMLNKHENLYNALNFLILDMIPILF